MLSLALCACVREVRVEKLETPVEAGVAFAFEADGVRRWVFDDGAPAQSGRSVRHAFLTPGRHVVRGYDGDTLLDERSFIVAPRPTVHRVPADAAWACFVTQPGTLAQLTDAAERVIGGGPLSRWLEARAVLSWAVEGREAGAPALDPLETVALFGWEDAPRATVTAIGVRDEATALTSLQEWLLGHEWQRVGTVLGLHRYESEDRSLDVFFDRGTLYAVDSPLTRRVPSAQSRVAGTPELGLAADPRLAPRLDALASGQLVTWWRTAERSVVATLRLSPRGLTWEGDVLLPSGGWALTPSDGGARLTANAPETPSLAVSSFAPPLALAALWPDFDAAAEEVPELRDGLQGLGAPFDLLVYPDVEGFVRATLADPNGLPHPRVTLLLEAPVLDAPRVEPLVRALLERWTNGAHERKVGQTVQWVGGEGELEVTLTPRGLFLRAGHVDGRPLVDLRRDHPAWETPGHVGVKLDLGALKRDLLRPYRLSGIDPRRSLSTQAAASTVLEHLTSIEVLRLDLEPRGNAIAFQLEVGW